MNQMVFFLLFLSFFSSGLFPLVHTKMIRQMEQATLNQDLTKAIRSGNVELVKEILDKGASPSELNVDGYTPIAEAIIWAGSKEWSSNYLEIVKLLIQKGAPINGAIKAGQTPLDIVVSDSQMKNPISEKRYTFVAELKKLLEEHGAQHSEQWLKMQEQKANDAIAASQSKSKERGKSRSDWERAKGLFMKPREA